MTETAIPGSANKRLQSSLINTLYLSCLIRTKTQEDSVLCCSYVTVVFGVARQPVKRSSITTVRLQFVVLQFLNKFF